MKRKLSQELVRWKESSQRLPLVLNGARQVGKTYILLDFAKNHYENYIYVNLEVNQALASFFDENISPERIIRNLEVSFNQRILPEKTLIILDEIQSSSRALTALKYFQEEASQYHVACAGSLLGVAINRGKYSYPVGKIQTLTMFSLDFEEFLWSMRNELLAEEIRIAYEKMEALSDVLHKQALEFYRLYLIIGGMPAVIKKYLESKSLLDVPILQNEIVNNYIADMAKYSSNAESVKIRACYNSLPAQLAKDNKKFQYKIVQKGGTAAIFGASIEWLNLAGIILKCQKIDHAMQPISAYVDLSSFKLYMADVGLLTMKSAIPQQIILGDLDNNFLGALTENYVAGQLSVKYSNLYYWESAGQAELDFVLQKADGLSAIEVKKGIHTKSKSLSQFIGKYQAKEVIRLSAKNFGQNDSTKAVPLYATFCI